MKKRSQNQSTTTTFETILDLNKMNREDIAKYMNQYLFKCTKGKCVEVNSNEFDQAFEKVIDWVYFNIGAGKSENEKYKPWLLLCGGCGLGKTTIAYIIANFINLTLNGKFKGENGNLKPLFINAIDLINQFDPLNTNKMNALNAKHYLFIDDLGTESSFINYYGNKRYPVKEFLEQRSNYNINKDWQTDYYTIITTNLTPSEITKRYMTEEDKARADENLWINRIGDRFAQKAYKIIFNGKSFRRL